MLRRQARLRREYLYRKSLEGKEREEYEKKRLVKVALAEGKPIPTELKGEEEKIRKASELDDDNTAVLRTHVDDEYNKAGLRDPKVGKPSPSQTHTRTHQRPSRLNPTQNISPPLDQVLITTSRDPSSRLKAFAKELKLVFPNSQRMNRGNQVVPRIVEAAKSHDFTDIVLVQEHRGEPDGMIVCHLPFGPTAYFGMYNTVLRHDIADSEEIGTVSQQNPHLIFENFVSKLGLRTANILKYLFPTTKQESRRTVSFIKRGGEGEGECICFRHHSFEEDKSSPDQVSLQEQGPRFDLRLYQIKLGTVDQTWVENEWVLRPFHNSKNQKL